jgi:hypothetical protein
MADASQYGHQDEHLAMIITSTSDALDRMQRLHGQVQMHAETIPTVNRSVSGNLLAAKFDRWSQTHQTIVQQLHALNQKATALRNLNNNTSQQAGESAR